jgi:hypothetical protein
VGDAESHCNRGAAHSTYLKGRKRPAAGAAEERHDGRVPIKRVAPLSEAIAVVRGGIIEELAPALLHHARRCTAREGPAEERQGIPPSQMRNVFSNHNYFPRRCNAELAPPASRGKKFWHVRRFNELGGEFGITPRRLRVSLPAPSPGVAKVKFPAFPPLVLRCSSGRRERNYAKLHIQRQLDTRAQRHNIRPEQGVSGAC